MNLRAKVCLKVARSLKAAPFQLQWQPRRELAFKSSATAADVLTLRNVSISIGPKIRVAEELDLAPDLLVLDYGLGTIGLVGVASRNGI